MSMSDKSRSHRRSCCAAIAVCAAIVPAVADAQDAEIDRIEAIERKIHGLESELQRLKGELGEAKQQLRQSRSEALRAKEGARQAREAANRARQDAAKVVTIEAPATRPAPHAPAAPAAPPGCCRLGRHHGRHAARPADYRDRRWPDVVRNRRVVAVRYGRLLPKPAANDWNVHLEFSGQTVFHPNVNSNGIPGVSRTTLSFGARIAFDQLVDTGPLSYYQVGVTQSKLPGVPAPRLEFNGGYIEGSVVSTGEDRRYSIDRDTWRPKPEHPFSLAEGGIGALGLAVRYSTVDLNSNVTPGVSQNVTGGIYGGRQNIGAVALSWYPNDWLRFMLQFQYVDVNKLNFSGHSTNRPALRDACCKGPGRLV